MRASEQMAHLFRGFQEKLPLFRGTHGALQSLRGSLAATRERGLLHY